MPLFLFIVVDIIGRKTREKLYKRGVQLEQKYAPDSEYALLHQRTFLDHRKNYRFNRLSIAGFWLPAIVAFTDIFIGIFLLYNGWTLI
ncbi:hypothetical protein [Candidatus Viridilinea mediisalina]|uniref:hypothetical protein n=1 Tax=Candidatus Viridilinea mediisalina TaxID=2024553 RepID=UPI000F597D83|nr:hypothetical protein [Candidatus Viridilinea mediisalina]